MSLMPENPYLPDKGQQLAMLLMSLGGGISQAAASGQGGLAGVAPGISNFANTLGAARQQQEADALRRWQISLQERALSDKEKERQQKIAAANTVAGMIMPGGGGEPPVPGMNVPPSKPRMGPDTYETRTAGLEGGTRNGGMVFNELGSGAYGPYQFMPATWADVRANNPDLNLPADMTTASREQHDAAHTRFKAGNARALQSAGFEPTPQNLYLAHRFGVGGATNLLRSGDDKMLADVLPIDWQRQNPDMRGQTVGGFKRLAGERMQGVGVPYQANGETTSYNLTPTALPAFEGMPGPMTPTPRTLPAGQAPSFSAPVMPQPQQAPQAPPQAAPSQSPPQAQAPVDAPPMSPPQVPMPMLPAQIANEINTALKVGAITPEQALARRQQVINDLWNRNQTAATAAWQQQWDAYKFNRGQNAEETRFRRGLETEGEWVRGPDGVERWQPKSARAPGQVRYEKPPAAGTETGDIHILERGDPATPEYAGAYNRIRTKLMDGPDGLKYAPDMSTYRPPTFQPAGGGVPAASAASGGENSAPPGLVAVGAGKERKYTEAQGKDFTYASRLDNSIPQLEAMVKGDDGKYTTSRLPSSYQRMKMDSKFVPDSMLDDTTKAFRRVTKDIVTAILRRESGAAIPDSEYAPEFAKYIPQPGDSNDEIAAKIKALKLAARSIAAGSGRPMETFGYLSKEDEAATAKPPPIRIDMSGKRQ